MISFSRPSKGVRPSRRSDEHLPFSKAAGNPKPLGGAGAKKSAVSARGGKVIDSRNRQGGVGGVGGGRKGIPSAARKTVPGKEKVF